MKFLKYLPIFAFLLAFPAGAVDVIIKDPSGAAAGVNDEGQLNVKAIVESELTNTSEEDGLAFTWTSTVSTGDLVTEIMTIKNDSSDLRLHFDQIWIGAQITEGRFEAGIVTSGTAGGTTVTGRPLNNDLAKVADATAFGDASVTGGLAGTTMAILMTAPGQGAAFDLEGAWIFGKDDVFFVRSNTNGVVHVTVTGHFDKQ